MVRWLVKIGLIVGLAVGLLAGRAAPLRATTAAQGGGAYEVVSLVNALRAEYGLYPYTIDQALMTAAQQQSDYQASIGQISHTGAGGSRPKDRAAVAGYAPAGGFYIHENIWGGTAGTAANAVAWWRNSALHFEGMTSTRYTEAGAGMAVDASGLVYITIVFAHRTGAAVPEIPGGADNSTSSGQTSGAARATAIPALPYEPVVVSTREVDGSIWHQVKEGQNFSDIAEEYAADLYDILAINNKGPEDIIHPGDRLMIEPPYTPTPEPPTATPSATPTPTITPTPQPGVVATADEGLAPLGDLATMAALAAATAQARLEGTATAEAADLAMRTESPGESGTGEQSGGALAEGQERNSLVWVVSAVVAVGIGLVGWGAWLGRRRSG